MIAPLVEQIHPLLAVAPAVQEEVAIGAQAPVFDWTDREIRRSENSEVAVFVPSRQLWDGNFVVEVVVLDRRVAAIVTSIVILRAGERTQAKI